jgi:hypothetical protein
MKAIGIVLVSGLAMAAPAARSPRAVMTAGFALAVLTVACNMDGATAAASFPAELLLGGLLLTGAVAVRRMANELSHSRLALKRVRARRHDTFGRNQH